MYEQIFEWENCGHILYIYESHYSSMHVCGKDMNTLVNFGMFEFGSFIQRSGEVGLNLMEFNKGSQAYW